MSKMIHMLKSLGRRFWREIGLFWLVTLAGSIWALVNLSSLPSLAFHWLELLTFGWLAVRLALAEGGFHTHGGWEARPLHRWVPPFAQATLLCGVLLPALALRAYCVHAQISPDARVWRELLEQTWTPVLLIAGLIAVVIGSTGRILRSASSPLRGMISGTAVLLVALALLVVGKGASRLVLPRSATVRKSGSSGLENDPLAAAVRPQLEGGLLLGNWPPPIEGDASRFAREILRIPLRTGAVATSENVKGWIRWMRPVDVQMQLGIELRYLTRKNNPQFLFFVLRYSDGSYGPQGMHGENGIPVALPLMPMNAVVYSGSFLSPMLLPENSKDWSALLEDAELLIFGSTGLELSEVPQQLPIAEDRSIDIPVPNPDGDPDLFQAQVFNLVDHANLPDSDGVETAAKVVLQLDSRAVPHVLDRHPWAPMAWEEVVAPFLHKHADEQHIPQMLRCAWNWILGLARRSSRKVGWLR